MNCPRCGKENRDGAKWCKFCGASLLSNMKPRNSSGQNRVNSGRAQDRNRKTSRESSYSPEESRSIRSGSRPGTTAGYTKTGSPGRPTSQKRRNPKKRYGRALVLTFFSVFLIALVVCGFFFLPRKTQAEKLQEALDAGNHYLDVEKYDQAEVAFSRALKIDSHSNDAALGLARTYNAEGKPQKAAQMLQQVETNMMQAPPSPESVYQGYSTGTVLEKERTETIQPIRLARQNLAGQQTEYQKISIQTSQLLIEQGDETTADDVESMTYRVQNYYTKLQDEWEILEEAEMVETADNLEEGPFEDIGEEDNKSIDDPAVEEEEKEAADEETDGSDEGEAVDEETDGSNEGETAVEEPETDEQLPSETDQDEEEALEMDPVPEEIPAEESTSEVVSIEEVPTEESSETTVPSETDPEMNTVYEPDLEEYTGDIESLDAMLGTEPENSSSYQDGGNPTPDRMDERDDSNAENQIAEHQASENIEYDEDGNPVNESVVIIDEDYDQNQDQEWEMLESEDSESSYEEEISPIYEGHGTGVALPDESPDPGVELLSDYQESEFSYNDCLTPMVIDYDYEDSYSSVSGLNGPIRSQICSLREKNGIASSYENEFEGETTEASDVTGLDGGSELVVAELEEGRLKASVYISSSDGVIRAASCKADEGLAYGDEETDYEAHARCYVWGNMIILMTTVNESEEGSTIYQTEEKKVYQYADGMLTEMSESSLPVSLQAPPEDPFWQQEAVLVGKMDAQMDAYEGSMHISF